MSSIDNGKKIANILSTKYKWSKNAIVAVLGNMQQESSLDPSAFQKAGNWNAGVGLVQWTPGTKLQERAKAIGRTDYLTIDCQLAVLDYERTQGQQYSATAAYDISFDEFIVSSANIEYLVKAWLANYERAGTEKLENRLQYANEWADRVDINTAVSFVKWIPAYA